MILTPHETWRFLDSSKIQTYMECPRSFFYRYIMGWRSTSDDRNDLQFGKAIHAGMEILMNRDLSQEVTRFEAYQAFLSSYREVFPEYTDQQFPKKTPARALQMFDAYCTLYAEEDKKWETLYTEVAGTVPISLKGDRLTFRIDAIRLNTETGKIWVFEHKTASQAGRAWHDQWYLSIQVGIYTHVLHCLFDSDSIGGALVNGLVFMPKNIDFERVPVSRNLPLMETWLSNLEEWLDSIRVDMSNTLFLSEENHSKDPVFRPYRQNTTSCTKFFGCPYMNLCQAWPNPLAKIAISYKDTPPDGFRHEWWDPTKLETAAKHTFDLETPLVNT